MKTNRVLRIGLDFDNTIACYDEAISFLADEKFKFPSRLPRTKLCLRKYLRDNHRESEWTRFQGELYGPGMEHAKPFEGAVETMQLLQSQGHQLHIVSHRTRRPYAGKPHDLHAAAQEWIKQHLQCKGLFIEGKEQQANSMAVNFMERRDSKINKIKELSCQVFLDDLPEVLTADAFPGDTLGILFSPDEDRVTQMNMLHVRSWHELPDLLGNCLE